MRLGRRVKVPAPILDALVALFGASAGDTRVVEHSLYAKLHGNAAATTRRRRIYLRGSALEFFSDPEFMLHEYCHVIHQWEPRLLTVPRYLLEWIRRGYWNNRYEVEAREFAATNLPRFRALLNESD